MAFPADWGDVALSGLKSLARDILALSIPGKDVSCAELMLACGVGESCKTFEVLAGNVWTLIDEEDLGLAEAVRQVAPPVRKKKKAGITWGPEVCITREDLVQQALNIQKTEIQCPDFRFAERMLSRKAATHEWKHFALRTSSIWSQGKGEDGFLSQFLSMDHDSERQITELKQHVRVVHFDGACYSFSRPVFPQWMDIYPIPQDHDSATDGLFRSLVRFMPEDEGVTASVDTANRFEGLLDNDHDDGVVIPVNGRDSDHRKIDAPSSEVEDDPGGAAKLGSQIVADPKTSGSDLVSGSGGLALDNGPNSEAQQEHYPGSVSSRLGLKTGDTNGPHNSAGLDDTRNIHGLLNDNVHSIVGPGHVSTSAGPVDVDPLLASGKNRSVASSDNSQDLLRHKMAGLRDVSWPKLPHTNNLASRSASLPTEAKNGMAAQQARSSYARFSGTKKKFMNTRMGGKLSYNPPKSTDTYKLKVDSGYSMFETWGYALLGQYVGRMPSDYMINEMKKQWNVSAKFRIEEGWIIFTFESESDLEKVLQEGPYFIQGRPLLVKRVPDKFSFHRRDVATVPLWVRLHGLGKRYWHPDILSDIGSYIGKPLYMDTVTDEKKRSSYARVLVEINLAVPVKKKITLEYDDGDSFDCEFFVENQPKFCKTCCSLGHNEVECSATVRRATVQPAPPPRHASFAAAVMAPPNDAATKARLQRPCSDTPQVASDKPVSGVEVIDDMIRQKDSKEVDVDSVRVHKET